MYDITSAFPQPSEIEQLSKEVQSVFSSVAVPLIVQYVGNAWMKITDKLFDRIKVGNFKENAYKCYF